MHNIIEKFHSVILRATIKTQNKKKKFAEERKEAVDGRLFLLGIMCQEMCILLLLFASSCYLVRRTTYYILCITPSRRETHALCEDQLLKLVSR